MSAVLDNAAAAMGIPPELVQRSAVARATETGSSVDDVLAAWAGGTTVETPSPAPAADAAGGPTAAAEPTPAEQPEPQTAVAVLEEPSPAPAPVVQQVVFEEPLEPLEPVPLSTRVRTAVRVGAWTGAGLGLVGFLVAMAFWADTSAATPETGPIVQVDSTDVLVGVTLVSLLFGAIVASLSRAAAGWSDPAMELTASRSSTGWVGAGLGLVLGLVAGALLTSGFGTPIEGSEGLVELPVLPTLAIMLVGGAILGAATAALPQFFGTPVALDSLDEEEVEQVRGRLGNAVGIPMAGMLLLLLLVLPFAWVLIQSNHLTSGGAAIVAILVASGILGFAALAGSKPQMRITFGDFLWALIGIGTVLIIILAVLLFNAEEEHESDEGGAEAASVVLIV